ncbi:MAG: hypothetical protein AAGA54_22620 [Myxococcota bacterium]
MIRRAFLLGALALAGCARPAVTPASPTDPNAMLVVTLMPSEDTPTAVRMEVSNPGEAALEFCVYHTAFEGLRNDIFEVQDDQGAAVPYVGIMAKRAPPGPEHYATIAPHKFRVAEVDLTEGYALGPGTYRVRYRGTDISGLPDSAWLDLVVESPQPSR